MCRTSQPVIFRCTLVAMMISTSSTPWSARSCSTMVSTRSRTSGRFIGGSGSGDVVDRDDDLHPGAQQRVERLAVVRVVDRVADGRVGVAQALQRGLRVDHPGAGGEVDFDEAVTGEEHAGRALAVEGHDAGVGHGVRSRCRMGQRWARARRSRAASGLTAEGWPTTESIGTSEYESL
jgi:hypothetical protein